MKKEAAIGIALFALLILVMVLVYYASTSHSGLSALPKSQYNGAYSNNSHGSASVGIPIEITDPAYLPGNTTSLSLTFSNVSAYLNGSGWVRGSGFGPVNLLQLHNESETVSVLDIPNNSIIREVMLGIGSAEIEINGTAYSIILPGDAIYTQLANRTSAKANSSILVDLSPIVLAPPATNNVLQMRCTPRGYLVSGGGIEFVGQRREVTNMSGIETPSYAGSTAAADTLSIENATVSTAANSTDISIGVSSSSPLGAEVNSVVIMGAERFSFNTTKISAVGSAYASTLLGNYANAVSRTAGNNGIGSSLFNLSSNGSTGNPYISINASIYRSAVSLSGALGSILVSNFSSLFKLGGPMSKAISGIGGAVAGSVAGSGSNSIANATAAVYVQVDAAVYNSVAASARLQSRIGALPFSVLPDGSMTQSWAQGSGGAGVRPGRPITLHFSGVLKLGNATTISLVNGSTYRIIVTGSDGSYATYTVVAR
jgi:hypothetical protein